MNTTFIKIEGGGHCIGMVEIESRVNSFFDRYLLGKEIELSDAAINDR
jgi:hypothetical protein